MTGARAGYAAFVAPIDPQAFARDRRTGHTPVGFIIGVAACSLAALAALVVIAEAGALSAGIGLTLALLPIPALISGVLYLDRLEPEPPGLLVIVFLWGAAMAGLIVLISTATGHELITTPTLRADGFHHASAVAVIGIAVLEETLKGAALVGLLLLRPQEVDGTSDGLVYGSMVGLGFALIENIAYYTQADHYGIFNGVATTFLLRGLPGPVCQALFSSLIGAGIAYAVTTTRSRRWWAVAAGWIAAVALHALWNDALAASLLRTVLAYVIMTVVLGLMLVAVYMDRRHMATLIVRYLPQYESAGYVRAADISMLSSLRDRRQARQWARLHAGLGGLRDMAEFQLAATELGLLHRRSDRRLVDDQAFADRRTELLSGMQSVTLIFLSRLSDPPRPPWAAHGPSCFRPGPRRGTPPAPAPAQPAAAQPATLDPPPPPRASGAGPSGSASPDTPASSPDQPSPTPEP
jgi:RsiW-degrading membrane proteinase PrsW (M82 family)